MGLLRWQWTLANRGVVSGIIDLDAGRESVVQDGRVLSECARGEKPDGHTVVVGPLAIAGVSERPPIEAVISFDPALAICILRVDGHEVGPSIWPMRERPTLKPAASGRPWGVFVALGLVLVVALGLLLSRALAPPKPPPPDASLHGTARAMNGLFIAHFPPELEAKLALLPPSVGGVVLEDKEKRMTLVLAATPADPQGSSQNEPWTLQQRLRDEALANVPKGIARFEETARKDDTCLGERGAVVVGRLAYKSSLRGHVWSCAFVHDGAGYLFLYSVAEPADPATEPKAREAIDATELTHLADLGGVPIGSAAASAELPKE